MSNIIDVEIGNFDGLMANSVVVLDFYTDTCIPCKQMMPMFEKLASDEVAKAGYGKVNAAQNADLVGLFQVKSVPTFIVLKDGIETGRKTGVTTRKELESLILA